MCGECLAQALNHPDPAFDFSCDQWSRRGFIGAYRTAVDRQAYLSGFGAGLAKTTREQVHLRVLDLVPHVRNSANRTQTAVSRSDLLLGYAAIREDANLA
ncbi:hypothetical protein BLA6863_06809 [Burkholderia lata]|uniref:Uncharacterized protein n=2 Tax=Burkholderia lata (strain ATCC 17760 / DSM 23089 / LMG 22485 / NCIMB 9086 / R18194 / 383) TaxID=482957 RepID=A0A6P2S510_BURL3|nr:hypothetical protein BLA6863_06809 [Burkholderia lata]